MELPNQVIPSIQVDETITPTSNKFRITFSDAANSGDQHMLKCKVDACTHDGCQPRSDGVKGLFQVSSAVDSDLSTDPTTAITGKVAGDLSNIPSSFSSMTIVTTGSTSSGTAVTVSGTKNTASPAVLTTTTSVHSLGDLSSNAGLNFLFFNTFSGDDLGQSTAIHAMSVAHSDSGEKVASNTLTWTDANHGLAIGDTVQVAFGSSVYVAKVINGGSPNPTADVTFDRDIGTSVSGNTIYFTKVTASPCTVEETTKS